MKILLSWVAKHLQKNLNALDARQIIALFNIRTAEIESTIPLHFNSDSFVIMQVTAIDENIIGFCPELNQKITVPFRSDAQVQRYYIITRENNKFRWTSLVDLGSEKEGLMPSVHVQDPSDHSWKDQIPTTDYVLVIDNKSINHRPDLWGHYGIAREIAAFTDETLQPVENLLKNLAVVEGKTTAKTDTLTINLENPEHCSRIAGATIHDIDCKASDIITAIQLARCDFKPINAIVDITNFVMLDIGHPMHAFDHETFKNSPLIVRQGKQNEQLQLLDGQTVNITDQDIIIANNSGPVSLAGIMGGKHSGINEKTTSIVIEAAGFNPLTIRKTAMQNKLRSESSMRFEKHLDPMQNITALQRFAKKAEELNITANVQSTIVSVGKTVHSLTIEVPHLFLERQIGCKLSTEFVQSKLNKLMLTTTFNQQSNSYTVTVPTLRTSKDIHTQYDIAEEIVRLYGFENIPLALPKRSTEPFSTQSIKNLSYIKRYFAYALNMHEIKEYLLFDQNFIEKLPIDTTQAINVKNPMSLNWKTLVTSLIPHLLKAVENNYANANHLRFFEHNATWESKETFIETKKFAGIIFDKKQINFYTLKQELQTLMDMLHLQITWQRPKTVPAWYHPYKTAEIKYNNTVIGYAGLLHPTWMKKICSGHSFIFEINANPLVNAAISTEPFKLWSKFQDVIYDISIISPATISASHIEKVIKSSDDRIRVIEIVDFVEKPELPDQRFLTIRYTMNDTTKTMTKEDIDSIVNNITKNLHHENIQIR